VKNGRVSQNSETFSQYRDETAHDEIAQNSLEAKMVGSEAHLGSYHQRGYMADLEVTHEMA
jgi:hypothetical protein